MEFLGFEQILTTLYNRVDMLSELVVVAYGLGFMITLLQLIGCVDVALKGLLVKKSRIIFIGLIINSGLGVLFSSNLIGLNVFLILFFFIQVISAGILFKLIYG